MCCFRPHLSGRRPLHEFNQFEVHNVQPEWLPLRNAIAQCTMPNLCGRLPLHVYNRVFHKLQFAKKKRCNTSAHPSRVYINQI